MEEKDILLLQGLGYTVNKYGGIIDENGNYVNKVNYEGKEIASYQLRDEYDAMVAKEKQLSEIGFAMNPQTGQNEETQKNVALAKERIKAYQANPEAAPVPDWTDPYVMEAFDKVKEEDQQNKGEAHLNPESMQSSYEEGTVFEDIEDEDVKNNLKAINSQIQKIEDIDPDIDTLMEQSIDQDVITTGPGGTILTNPGEDANLVEKATYRTSKFLNELVSSAVKTVAPTGAGMEDKELKEKYKKLKEEKRKILVPIAGEKLTQVQSIKDQLTKEMENAEDMTESDRYAYAITQLEKEENRLKDYMDGAVLDSNIFTLNNAADWASLGLYDAYSSWNYLSTIRDKMDAGEELTPAENAISQSMATVQDAQKIDIEQNYTHDITGGLNESLKFLGFGWGGRAVGRGVSKAVSKSLTGAANRVVGTSANLTTQAALHPNTYSNAFKRYAGDFEMRVNEEGQTEILTGNRLYNTLTTEADNVIGEIEKQLEIARSSGNQEQVDKYRKQLQEATAYRESIKAPASMASSGAYGITEVLKEVTAEQFGGKILKGLVNNKVTRKLGVKKLADKVFDNKHVKPINDMASKTKGIINKNFGGIPGEKLIGSNTEEVFEEILVQATPTYGQSMDEYMAQVSELGSLDFYSKVIGQTILMQKGFQGVDLARKYYSIATNPELRGKFNEMKALYKELGKRDLNQNKFNELMMKAGEGNFSMQEYNNVINKYKQEGNIVEANKFEQEKLFNMALTAQKQGTLKEFSKTLNRAQYNANLAPETVTAITQIKSEINEMLSDNENYINNVEVASLKSKIRNSKKTIAELDSEIVNSYGLELSMDAQEALGIPILEEFDINNITKDQRAKLFEKGDSVKPEVIQYLTNKLYVDEVKKAQELLEKKLRKVTSYDHQTKLMIEKDYLEYIDKINKKVFKRNMTPEQFQTVVNNIPTSRQKGISKQRLNELHQQTAANLNSQKEENKVTPQSQNPDDTSSEVQVEEVVEAAPVQTQTQTVLQTAVNEAVAQDDVELSDPFDTSVGTVVNNDEIDFLPSENLGSDFKNWAEIFENEMERQPSFQDFYDEAVTSVDGDKTAFNKSIIKFMGQSWEAAGLGNSNWEQLYKDNYTELGSVTRNLINKIMESSNSESVETVNEKSEATSIQSTEPTAGVNPLTGESVKLTPVAGKTLVVTPKANYNALNYVDTKEIQEIDGKRVVVYDRTDTKQVPTLNTESFVDVKSLLHPEKNNPGAVWNINVTTEQEWGDSRIKVSENNPVSGEPTNFISFGDWIKKNQPKNMSLEEFKQTDEFIAKVPIYYTDSAGNNVAFVADVDWYNPMTVRDQSKERGDMVDLNNLTPTHKQKIQEGRENAMNMRRAIMKEGLSTVTVTSKDGSPLIKIPANTPAIPLSQASPTSKIAMFMGTGFVNLDGSALDMNVNEIVNLDSLKKEARARINRGEKLNYPAYYLSPVNQTDTKKRFMAIGVTRINENGDLRAMSEDVETAKLLIAANKVLKFQDKDKGLTPAEAQSIRTQVKDLTNVDIMNFDNVYNLVNSLIALQGPNGKYTLNDKVPVNGKLTTFYNALIKGSLTPVQNTNLNSAKSHGLVIKRGQNGITVEKPHDTYEEFLKTRLSTNIVSYNMGTEESPAYTHSVQPIIKVEPIEVEVTPEPIQVIEVDETNIDEALNEANKLLDQLNFGDISTDTDYLVPTLEDPGTIKEGLNIIPGLRLDQQQDVVNHVLSIISSKYDLSTEMNVKDFSEDVRREFSNFFGPIEQEMTKSLENLNNFYNQDTEKYQRLKPAIDNLQLMLNKINIVNSNYATFFEKAYLDGMRKGFIPSTIKTTDELTAEISDHTQEEMYQKNYSKSSNEIVHKDKISKKLRRIFSTINNNETGFLGLPKYESYDMMYNTIATLVTSPLPTKPTFSDMKERLEMYAETYPWMKPLLVKLDNAPSDIKNSFTYNMYKFAAKASFVPFTELNNGMESAVWFSNANNIKQKVKETWNNNFKRSNITNGNTINTEKLTKLYEQWESWGEEKHETPDAELRQWLSDFGIVLSDGAWKTLKEGKMTQGKGVKTRPVPFEDMFFDTGKRRDMLFSNLANYAKQHKGKKQGSLDYTANTDLHPFSDMNNIFKSLVDVEAKNNRMLMNITRRDGDKTVSEIVFPSFYMHNVAKLIKDAKTDDKVLLNDMKELSFSADSHVLELLLENPEFSDILDYGETGLMSMKKLFSSNPAFSSIDQLSPIDYMFHQRAMFQYMKVESFKADKDGFPLRVATMSTPTNSDKGRMMLMKTAVYDLLNAPNALVKTEQGYTFHQELKELLYNRLVMPELRRIVNARPTNIKDYDKGAVRFNLIPELNSLLSSKNVTALEFLKGNSDMEAFKSEYFDSITAFLEKSIMEEATANTEETGKYVNNDVDMFNNRDYISRIKEGNVQEKQLAAEIDYTINSMIANMNTLQLIAGDPALYFKSKADGTSTDVNEQIKASRDLGTNLGKRLALMIAPGNVLAESENETYMQIFLDDESEVAPNIEDIVKWHYGKQDAATLEELRDARRGEAGPEVISRLQNKFPLVKDFFDIETTDAQEYTTLAEHLRTLVGQGRINESTANVIVEKSKRGESLLKEELQLVLQPIKPVYTGDIIDKAQDVRRIMYIKSSSFPLIPDMVKGTNLEPLMNKMMKLEEKHGTTVRASYQSANKVGAMNNPIKISEVDLLDELDTSTGFPVRALQLDRINMKIQQDVPYKSDYQKEDKVSMGTQIFKLLFGDGMTKIDGFIYKGQEMNGEELRQEFFNAFSEMINIQKDALLYELGLDGDYNAADPKYAAEKLQELLKAEAEERNFPENDIKALELHTKDMYNGDVVHHFKLPLWFSGNSNKFEAMLNAIIGNKMFKQKLPGNSFVVGSGNGLQLRAQEEGIPNNTVFIGDYKGGELIGNEVLAPSKIRINGQIIDLFERNKRGKYKYILETKDGYVINEKALDPELFRNFTFRTPTSSHGSGSTIKVVGFIPSIMGDLMITPKNFITQMGQDFDIDKLTSYQFWTYYNQGKTERFNEDHLAYEMDQARKKLRTRDDGAIAGQAGAAVALLDGLMKNNSISEEDYENIFSGKYESNADLLDKIERTLKLKLAQNNFVEIHNSVYSNPSAEVQKKINKALSMDFAENQAEAIDAINTSNETKSFNILSPEYQMNKMISGSTGSLAIGIYAKGVTLNSLIQQNDVPVRLMTEEIVSGERINREKTIRIGNLYSDGSFGKLTTIVKDGANTKEAKMARALSQVQDERVNTATDNEKAQILGRVGITSLDAVAVDNLLSLLGFDAEINEISVTEFDASNPFHRQIELDGEQFYYTEYSIPYLLHSQPIIKEYFKRLSNSTAIIEEYSPEAEQEVTEELLKDFNRESDFYGQMTGEKLVEQIQGNNYNTDFQKNLLVFYKDMILEAKKLKEMQDIVDMSNLGKSMWELKDKIEKFRALPQFEDQIQGATSLLGRFDFLGGEYDIGDGLYFTPTTNQGVMIGAAMSLGRNLFFNYFPYYDQYISSVFNDIQDHASYGSNDVKFNETVFQEMKKFITAATRNNLFLNSPSQERMNTFMDTADNESLSTYISKIRNSTSEDTGIKAVKNNSFLSYLTYERGEGGKPSLIKFDNTEIANVSEEGFHDSFRELFIKNIPLPDRNGEAFSTRKLAQELVAYSYLGGGIVREAIEFHRFIPIEYYDELDHPNPKAQNVTRALQNYDTMVSDWGSRDRLKNFTRQFFQNNPQYAKQHPKAEIKGSNMVINENQKSYPRFVSQKIKTRDKLKQSKWMLFEQVHNNQYKRIDVLGEFGMSEYDYDNPNLKTIITKPVVESPAVQQTVVNQPPREPNLGFSMASGENAKTLLDRVANTNITNNPTLSDVAKALSEIFNDKTTDVAIKVIKDDNLPFQGRFIPSKNEIVVNVAKSKDLATTFVHEFVHSVTSKELAPYFSEDWTQVLDGAPKEVIQMQTLMNEYKNKIQKKYPEEYETFIKKYNDYKNNLPSNLTERELSIFYPVVNVKEFLAVSLSNNQDFIKEASQISYKRAGINIFDRFIKVLDAILNKFSGVENNIARDILATNLAVVQVLNTPVTQEVGPEQMAEYVNTIKQDDIFGDPDGTNLADPEADGPTEVSMLPNEIKPCD
jgi:hypothetical protein